MIASGVEISRCDDSLSRPHLMSGTEGYTNTRATRPTQDLLNWPLINIFDDIQNMVARGISSKGT